MPDDPLEGVLGGSAQSDPLAGVLGPRSSAPPSDPFSSVLESARKGVVNAGKLPFEVINAVLGAPQRAVAGALATGKGENPVGMGIYGAFHPNDPTIEQRAETKYLGASPQNGFLAGARTFGFQTATDPLTYFGGVGLLRSVGSKVLEAAGRGLLEHTPQFATGLRDFLRGEPELDRVLGPAGKAAYQRVMQANQNVRASANTADEALLLRNKAAMDSGEIPDEVRQRLLREAFVEGDEQMRADALKEGFRPTEQEARTPQTGILKYNVKPDYEYTGKVGADLKEQPAFTEIKRRLPNAGFELHADPNAKIDPSSLYDRMRNRLISGNSVIALRRAETQLKPMFIKGGSLEGQVKNASGLAQKIAHDPFASEIKGAKFLTGWSDAYKDALFVNSIPHMGNVAVLLYLHGGMPAVKDALGFFAHGVPENLEHLTQEGGLTAHYAASTGENPITKLGGVKQLRQGMSDMLIHWDNAARAALLKQELHGVNDVAGKYRAFSAVADAMGNYESKARIVQVARAVGGFFPQWRLGVVPKSMTRALMLHPERVERLVRGEHDISEQTQKQGYSVEFGKPTDSFAEMLLDAGLLGTGQMPKYVTSPATFGPLASFSRPAVKIHGQPEPVAQAIANWGIGMLPFGQTLQTLGGEHLPGFLQNPYEGSEKAPSGLRALLSGVGAYTRNNPREESGSDPLEGVLGR